jgi:hypothetical protein
MKSMTKLGAVLFAVFTTSASYGGEQPHGVADVDVVIKQNPRRRAVTDAGGNFALNTLPPGSYTLTFRAAKAKDTKSQTTNKVTVATSYSIKIDGTKRSVNQNGLTSDKIMAGIDVRIEVGANAKVRGQVAAGALKKMVWISQEPGSHIPGHWAEAGSAEAAAHPNSIHGADDMRDLMNRNPNMRDPAMGGPPQPPGR